MKSQALGRGYQAIPFAMLAPAIGFALVLLIYWIQQPLILSDFGIVSLCNQSVALSLAAMAQTLVVIAGGIDLSVGSLISLSTCFAATYMGTSEGAAVPVLCATLLIGVLTGALNGALVVFGQLEPLIATLGTSFVFGGIALQIRPQPGGSVPPWFATMLTGNLSFLPYSLVLLLVTVCLIWVPLRKSRIGRAIQAVGNNEHSAYISGLNPKKAKLFAYATAGLLTAVAGLFITAQTTSGDPNVGDAYTLNSIAAVVLGGVSLRGGRGRIAGPILSGFLLSTIVSALLAWGISALWQSLIQGLVLLLVLAGVGLQIQRSESWRQFFG
ncbi:MAG TPA: ABC transporter permease [Chthoniobacterales bacterium]|jgi:ribose/xylose/arabinose/galactoside ABC-type transport system permease subunit|nr:ABC transporter permease [Chthoniobacterales bacterium]